MNFRRKIKAYMKRKESCPIWKMSSFPIYVVWEIKEQRFYFSRTDDFSQWPDDVIIETISG